ncbi:thioesterase [Chromatium okenii]|uniref:acyl-CoA thioesterase n=1 Tax=Chromatium okenii TaxID=61644 RepID=UPI0019078128|nr:acyl-CoA thioesterase [Chromatium okenii]MBK1641601.1 thioesterase [Chromatium okenii]
MSTPFAHPITVRLHDTDAAGRLFFAHLFRHAHDAFEAFMDALELPVDTMIRSGQLLLPITHAQADYHLPLRHGDRVLVQVSVADLRRRSFAIQYAFRTNQDALAATALTVHCQINVDGTAVAALAPELKTALQSFT